jgi:hypothetical protein
MEALTDIGKEKNPILHQYIQLKKEYEKPNESD